MKTYTARAVRWERGWELHVAGVGVTQVRTLATAEQQVRDLVETMLDIDASDAVVTVLPDLGGLEVEAFKTKAEAEEAARLQIKAAAETRAQAEALRERGLSVSDIAVVMKVSRGRVSQLLVAEAKSGSAKTLKVAAKSGEVQRT